jgi:hypothetical protein
VSDTSTSVEARLDRLERALASMESRLREVEGASWRDDTAATSAAAGAPGAAPAAAGPATDLAGALTLIGRTFVIFAGAYLLRALTESGTLDRGAGAAAGLAYAAAWSLVAWRLPAARALSATFFGACTVLIGFPLIWEATLRFALLTPTASASALAVTTGLVLLTAWRRNLHALAWIATIAACGLAAVLLVGTGHAVPFAVSLILFGVATLWLGYDREWKLLRWVSAAFADLAAIGLVGRAIATPPRDEPSLVVAVQLLLLVGYLGSIAVRTLVRGRAVVPFEVVQAGATLVAGLAGAMVVAHQVGTGAVALGTALIALAAACYAVAFAFLDREQARGNFYFYTSLALVFALAGSDLLLGASALGLAWGVLAIVVGAAGRRFGRAALTVHSAVYVTAAAGVTGLLSVPITGLLASASGAWPGIAPVEWAVFGAVASCLALAVLGTERTSGPGAGASRWALALLASATTVGAVIVTLRGLLPAEPGSLHAAAVATLRTGVLAVAAMAVAWLGRHAATREFGTLLYAVLAAGALKLLVEDFRTSPPAMLVVALALYGGALIVGPRIARTRPLEPAGVESALDPAQTPAHDTTGPS